MVKRELDSSQRSLLKLIKNGSYSDMSIEEIQDRIGVDYPQAIFNKLTQLENRGLIRKDKNGTYQALDNPIEDIESFPLLRSAQCGNLGKTLSLDEISERIMISTKILPITTRKEEYIFVRAKGDSMEPIIKDGEFLFVHLQDSFDEGDMVLVIHNNYPKIKKIKITETGTWLVSYNKEFKDQIILKDDEVRILGVVKKIISNP